MAPGGGRLRNASDRNNHVAIIGHSLNSSQYLITGPTIVGTRPEPKQGARIRLSSRWGDVIWQRQGRLQSQRLESGSTCGSGAQFPVRAAPTSPLILPLGSGTRNLNGSGHGSEESPRVRRGREGDGEDKWAGEGGGGGPSGEFA